MILETISVAILVYYIVMQLQMVVLAIGSAVALRRSGYRSRHGRLQDMLSSDTSPSVSIVVPAFNEESGIVEAVRSMAMLAYPRFEIVVVNDGSDDSTLERLTEAFGLFPVTLPFRHAVDTAPIRAIYRTTLPLPITVVDKENGGRADALNAGINVARYPYVLLTDADVVLDHHCLVRAMRHVVDDRVRTVAVGGNVRPINGSRVSHGRVIEPGLPDGLLERMQVLEYLRSFVAARPAWSAIRSLTLVSGAFGVFRRDVLTAVGGLTSGHLGEDLDLTMRVHRHMRTTGTPYRIVYAPDAVAWTEVPRTRAVLRRQRIRWHRGLMRAIGDFRDMLLNPRYGTVGMVGWPALFFFEFLAPIVEFAGWILIPFAWAGGWLDTDVAVVLLLMAFFVGAVNSLVALLLDEAYGYFNSPLEALQLLTLTFVENLGIRQQTVAWRMRALLGGRSTTQWGDMQRRGVANLARR